MSAPVLRPNPRLDPRVSGDTWQVHGGGFHQIQKYMVAPEFLPADLTWFKWEAYSTWIFAFALLMTTYYANPSVYLLDARGLEYRAFGRGAARARFAGARLDRLRPVVPFADRRQHGTIGRVRFRVAGADHLWFCHVFSGRGAFPRVGALMGSIMVGNVLFLIIQNQRRTVAALIAGKEPDPIWGHQAKQRSIHNT